MSGRARVVAATAVIVVGWIVSAVGTPGDESHGLVPIGMALSAGGAAIALSGVGWYERLTWRLKALVLFVPAVISPVVADTLLR